MIYGFCPLCGAPGKMRERRMDGNDTCTGGHVYPTRLAQITSRLDDPLQKRLRSILAQHDAGVPGYRFGDPDLLDQLLAALGWTGGTIHDALVEARYRSGVETKRYGSEA